MDFANWELNGALLRAFVNKSGDTVRWLEEKGVKFDVLSFSPKQMHRVFHNPPRGGPEILKALIETCNRYGVQITWCICNQNIAGSKKKSDRDHGNRSRVESPHQRKKRNHSDGRFRREQEAAAEIL